MFYLSKEIKVNGGIPLNYYNPKGELFLVCITIYLQLFIKNKVSTQSH